LEKEAGVEMHLFVGAGELRVAGRWEVAGLQAGALHVVGQDRPQHAAKLIQNDTRSPGELLRPVITEAEHVIIPIEDKSPQKILIEGSEIGQSLFVIQGEVGLLGQPLCELEVVEDDLELEQGGGWLGGVYF
jgi:hypothetical protein